MFPPPVLTRSGSKGQYQNGYFLNRPTRFPYLFLPIQFTLSNYNKFRLFEKNKFLCKGVLAIPVCHWSEKRCFIFLEWKQNPNKPWEILRCGTNNSSMLR